MSTDWDDSHDWINTSTFSASNVKTLNTLYHELHGSALQRQQRSVQFTDLNADQTLAHNMVIGACL